MTASKRYYPILREQGSITHPASTRPSPEPQLQVWVVYNDIGQPLAVRTLTTAQADRIRRENAGCTVELLNPPHQQQ